MNKKSFILHIDSLDIVDDMSDDQAGQLLKAIKAFQHGECISLSPLVKMAFTPLKNQFIRDDEKYENTCKRRAVAGSKGGKQRVANQAIASKSKQRVANQADNKNKNDSDSKNKTVSKNNNDNKILRDGRFAIPTLHEIQTLIINKNYYVDAERFFHHYESNGWKVGKNPMKSWQSALASWNSRDKKENVSSKKQSRVDAFNEWIDSDDVIEGECDVIN